MMMNNEVVTQIPIIEARKILTKLPEQLAKAHQAAAITRHGTPVLAVLPWELYEAIEETLEIMGDPELMAALRESAKEIEEGKLISLADVKAELGLEDTE